MYIIGFLFFLGCDSENGSDCFKVPGALATKLIDLDTFSKLVIYEGIELEINQGTKNTLEVSFGENLIDNITAQIVNDRLEIRNNSTCNLFRDFEPAKIVLTAIDLTEIRNASQFRIFSNQKLGFNSLRLLSENFFEDAVNVGDFEIEIENEYLEVVSNNVSNFKIKGSVHLLHINFAAGQGKFEGSDLQAQEVRLFHRGINEVWVYPIQKISGELRSSGNVISFNRPPTIEVQEFYTGKLIFRN